MGDIGLFLIVLAIHWVADFACQSRWMGDNKSSKSEALAIHVITYSIVLGCGTMVLFGPRVWSAFVPFSGLLHLGTDAVTSKVTAWLGRAHRWYSFWTVIGFDQLLHQVALGFAIWLLLMQ